MINSLEVQDFIETTFKNQIIKQYQLYYQSNSSLTQTNRFQITLKLDLIRVFRIKNPLGSFIVSNYPQFLKCTERAIVIIIQKYTHGGSVHGKMLKTNQIHPYFFFSTCPLPTLNIEKMSEVVNNLEFKNGIMIYIKDAHILQVKEPQAYLSTWTQKWKSICGCSSEAFFIKDEKQSLVQIVKYHIDLKKINDMKQIPKCQLCQTKMKLQAKQKEVYKNCQKIRFSSNLKLNQNYQQMFQEGIFQCYVDQQDIKLCKQGQFIDMCIYLSAKSYFIKSDSLNVKSKYCLYMICAYQSKQQNSAHNLFFSNLNALQMVLDKCTNIKEEDVMLTNYKAFQQVISKVKFPYVNPQNFLALKSAVINSVYANSRNVRVNLFLMSDEPELLQKWINLPTLNIKKFPKINDSYTLINSFFLSCHHSILMVISPSRKQLQFINNFLENKIMENLNVTLWVIVESSEENKDLKKNIKMDNFEIVLDLSFEKNRNVCSAIYQQMIDQKLISFFDSKKYPKYSNNYYAITIKKKNGRLSVLFDDEQNLFAEQDFVQQDKAARRLLQLYYLRVRVYEKMSYQSLSHLQKIAQNFAYFRYCLNEVPQKLYLKSCEVNQFHAKNQVGIRINLLDALLALFFDEQSNRHRGVEPNSMFATQISKLILNEQNCSFLYRDYVYKQDGQISEQTRHITKDTMFKIILNKIVNLVYKDEVDPLQNFKVYKEKIEQDSQQSQIDI